MGEGRRGPLIRRLFTEGREEVIRFPIRETAAQKGKEGGEWDGAANSVVPFHNTERNRVRVRVR